MHSFKKWAEVWGIALVLCLAGTVGWLMTTPTLASTVITYGYNLVQNNGTPLTQRQTLNCGTGMTCSDSGGVTLMTATGSGGTTSTIASGTSTMGTGAISSGTCASAVTTAAVGVATTDAIIVSVNADPTGVTGYAPSATGSLYIWSYPTSGNVNFRVCNNSGSSITPSAITLNWRVVR